MHLRQQVLGLSDEGTEDVIYDSQSARSSLGVDPSHAPVPDAITLRWFRKQLTAHGLGEQVFRTINAQLEAAGLRLPKGTIVDAPLIAAAPTTMNRGKARDSGMRSS